MRRLALVRLAITVGLVLLLELACQAGWVSRRSMIPPSQMATKLIELMQTQEFWSQVWITALSILTAALCAAVAGFITGVVLHRLPRVRRAIEPLIASYYALPFFVLYPLFIVLFGMNPIPIIFVGFIYAVMAMVTGTLAGLDRIPAVLHKVGRTYQLDGLREAIFIQLPAAAPFVLTGAKLALGYAITGVIGSEFILSGSGLGYSIAFAYNNFDDRTMYALLLFIMILVTGITILLQSTGEKLHHRSGAGRMGGGKASLSERLVGELATAAVIIGVWQLLHQHVGTEALASPMASAARLWRLVTSNPDFWGNVAETSRALGYSLLISCLAGGILGVLIGASRSVTEVTEPMLVTLYSLPKVTLYPVVLLFFGIGLSAKVAFGALYGMIPMMLITLNAIRNMNPSFGRTARVLHLTRLQMLTTIMIPATVPEVVSGLRISFSITLLGVMIGEMFASRRGLGFMIMNSMGVNDTATMMAVTVLVGLFAIVVNSALLALDTRMHRA